LFCIPSDVSRLAAVALHEGPEAWERVSIRRPAEIHPLLESVVAQLREAGFSQKEEFGVRLALEEALVNAIKHGHGGDPSKQVHVRYRVEFARVTVEVEDQGPGFRPEQVPDPLAPENLDRDCGRGLLLMRSFMTSVRYNDKGTCVTLCKCRTGD
jgi:serine/threonine-protein kinase RsbW